MLKACRIDSLLKEIDKGIEEYQEEFLIGLIEIDWDTYLELIDFTISILNQEIFVLKEEKNVIISLALVQFAINEYNNGSFWEEFAFRLNIEVSKVIKISKECFEAFCLSKGLYFHVGNVYKGYVTSILVHAIIPNSSAERFLEFLSDLYFKDLEEEYIDSEVKELIQYMHRLFSKFLEEDDINLVVQGSKMTIARQQLPKAFRIAFVKSPKIVTPLIERLLLYIDQSNYSEFNEYLANDRFDKYFAQFNNEYMVTSKVVNKSRRNSKQINKYRVAQYCFEDNSLFLQIPKQVIDSEFFSDEIRLEILIKKKVILSERLVLTKSRLFFKTEPVTVKIPKFAPQISYRITSGKDLIYDSRDLLYREFIIFNMEGKEINPKNLTDVTVKIVTNKENEVLTDSEINISFESNYRITTVYLNKESIILINDKVLSTNPASLYTQINSKYRYNFVSIIDNFGNVYDVYSKFPEIKLRIPYKRGIENFIFNINGKNYSLSDVSNYITKIIPDGSGDELGIIHINNELIEKNNPLTILIREKGSHKIYINEKIFILDFLQYEFDKSYYYKDKEAKLINLITNIDFAIPLKFPVKINLRNNDYFVTYFFFKGSKYEFRIMIPKLSWRLCNFHSYQEFSNRVWCEDIVDYNLYIKIPDIMPKLQIISEKGIEILDGKKVENEIRYSLDSIFQIKNQKPVKLSIKINSNQETITEIFFKPTILDFYIKYYDTGYLMQGLYTSWEFMGKGKLNIDIIYTPTQKIIKQYKLNSNETLIDQEIQLFYGEHEIIIYQIEEDNFFGEGTKKNILLWKKFIVGDPVIVYCKNKILKGLYCICEGERYQLSNFYLKDIRFTNKKGLYKATGMFLITDRYTGKKREWYFTKYNPFLLKYNQQNENMISFDIVDKDGDGLIYDTISKYVNPKVVGSNLRYKIIDSIEFELLERRENGWD